MQRNHKTCCVLFYDNTKYDEIAKLAYDSFVTFHKDEVDVHFITPYNIQDYPITVYAKYPEVNGIKKYIRGYDVMVTGGYSKLIILDVDTICCSRFDEFLDSDTDVLATLNYPLQESTDYWITPSYSVTTEDGNVIYDHANLNAGIICFNNPEAIKKVIDLSITCPNHFAEQSGLNQLAYSDKSFEVRAVDGPYPTSQVSYNARAKGVPRADMIKKGRIQNCWPNNIHGFTHEWLAERDLLDGRPSPMKRWYVQDEKLFTHDHKQIKCFHFVEGMGMQTIEKFNELINDFKTNWFNAATVEFFREVCNCTEFFKGYRANRFKIIVPSFNNEKWVEYNVASILNQSYTNYDVLYIDDASTDGTYNAVTGIVKDLPNWKVIRNEVNKGAGYNYTEFAAEFASDPNDILIHLDGDDWFYDDLVLEQLNDFYNENDYWMTYGGFVVWDGENEPTLPYPQSTPFPEFVHKHKKYRKDAWRASHLRTYRNFLFQAIKKEDLKDLETNEYYWHAIDLAWQFACMEMCPSDKIGLVDFYTCVYNHSQTNQIRTHERESANNAKYEAEIRNRKSYVEGLSGVKKPQVNLFDLAYYLECYDIPTKFTYCYEQTTGEFDMTIFCDTAIEKYIAGDYVLQTQGPVVARLFEQRGYFDNKLSSLMLDNYDKFDLILTYDKELLQKLPNAKFLPPLMVTHFNMLPNPLGLQPAKSELVDTYELPENAFQIYPKSKLVSAIASNKAILPGHRNRLKFINSIKDSVDLYGRGLGKELPSKLDGLRDYMFSVAIENVQCDDYYFTEKITECFLTGTVPIYHGCINIGEFFDSRGILYFETEEELQTIIKNLTPEKYNEMLPYIQANFEACFNWPLNNDMLYEMYYEDVINKYKK